MLRHLPASIHALALTQRGHAGRPDGGNSVTDFANDLTAFLDALHLGAGIIVGHSMGSAIALRFAIDDPERTLGLVLVAASPTMAGTEPARAFWDSTVSKLTDPVDPRLVCEMTEGLLVKPVPEAFVDAAVEEGIKVPAHVWKAAFLSRWNLEGDFSGQLGMIKAPTIIVWGDQDARYTRIEEEALASAISGSRLIVYNGAGHLLHWEEPRALCIRSCRLRPGPSVRAHTGCRNVFEGTGWRRSVLTIEDYREKSNQGPEAAARR